MKDVKDMKGMKRRLILGLAVAMLAALWLAPLRGQTPATVEMAVQAGRLIDGTSTTVREHATVLIGGGKVIDVQSTGGRRRLARASSISARPPSCPV